MSVSNVLSPSAEKAFLLSVGEWIWGTVQGCFNEKASLTQIIVDAIIGMVPLVGDVTAVRDLIAVSIGLIEDPEKRESKWQWILLVVLIVALIPVVGGVAKGVGRLVLDAAKSGKASAKVAVEIVQFLNRIGHGHAEKWLLKLRFAEFEAVVLEKLDGLCDLVVEVVNKIKKQVAAHSLLVPDSLIRRLDELKNGFQWLKIQGRKKIPDAIIELDQKLREIQAYIRSGGETTSRAVMHEANTGERATTYTDEAHLLEDGPLPARSARNGWSQNPASADPKELNVVQKYYKHEPGYPDLMARIDKKTNEYSYLAAYSGKVINRPLKPGEKVYRFFGPGGVTHGYHVDPSRPGGAWWGLGEPPKNAKQWRESAAVKDEWNRDGFVVVGTVSEHANIKSCVGTISEQYGKELPGQYLPGGGQQAYFDFSREQGKQLEVVANEVIATGKPQKWKDPVSGLEFEIRPTGWKDANGVHGYSHMPGPGTVQTAKLAARELASKEQENKPK